MNKLLMSLAFAAFAQNVFAGQTECSALQEGAVVNQFVVDWERTGTSLNFNLPVAWDKTALNFDIIYSVEINGTYIYAAVDPNVPNQLVELILSGPIHDSDVSGTLKAGDRESVMKRMAKFKEYQVTCR